jgi:hypothetical protein
MDEEKKNEVIQLFSDASKPSGGIAVKGNGNVVAGGDVHINKREVIRPVVIPGPGSVTPAQAKKIKDGIDKLVELEFTAGDPDKAKLYKKWWGMLQKRYQVTSYKEIRADLGDEAVKWLQQLAAKNRPKLRRADNAMWRNEHYKAIWAKARNLGLSKGDVYHIVAERFGKSVTSLKSLGEQDLKKLYHILMAK